MNFIPARPVEEVAHEYVEAFWQLYEPKRYLNRALRHLKNTEVSTIQKKRQGGSFSWKMFKMSMFIFLKFGVIDQTRWQFWSYSEIPIKLSLCGCRKSIRCFCFSEKTETSNVQ